GPVHTQHQIGGAVFRAGALWGGLGRRHLRALRRLIASAFCCTQPAPPHRNLRRMAVVARVDEVHRVISTAVDGAFYRAVNPDLAESGLDPIRHYVLSGWREGRDPAPWFSTRAYVEANPELVKAGW